MGYAEEAPYDAIHVGAAAPVVPQAVSCVFSAFLCFQLKLSEIYRRMTSRWCSKYNLMLCILVTVSR